jgi:nucleotide-binding universal stress UspA family protein
MKQVTRILVPIDGSEESFRASELAIDLAKKYNADLILLSVVPSEIKHGGSSGIIGLVPTGYLKKYKEEANAWFEQIRKKNSNNIDASLKIVGEVITTPVSIVGGILEYAENKEVDIIVIGSTGKTGFKKLLLGSIANGVVTYSPCPVFVVK